jgi:plastocyanin
MRHGCPEQDSSSAARGTLTGATSDARVFRAVDPANADQTARPHDDTWSVPLQRRSCVTWLLLIITVFAGVVVKSDPSAAANAVVAVSITEKGFSPAVVVVPAGTVVRWQNNGMLSHSLGGQVRSPGELQPGGTYQRRFTALGQYSYVDGRHPDNSGTVVVTAGSSRPPHAHGNATYHYSATLKLFVSDEWTYYDSEWDSTTGPCNAQVGSGERLIHLDVHFPNVTYLRNQSIGVEGLEAERSARGRFGDSGETIKSQVAGESSPELTCPNGITERMANQPASCQASFTGKPVLLTLGWGPLATENRFLFTNQGPEIKPACHASQIVGALVLVGVGKPLLPLNLVGDRVNYDEGQTNALTSSELRSMRAGRAFTTSRRVDLNFTTPCCEGFNPNPGGVWARIANIHRYVASMTISFTPRS